MGKKKQKRKKTFFWKLKKKIEKNWKKKEKKFRLPLSSHGIHNNNPASCYAEDKESIKHRANPISRDPSRENGDFISFLEIIRRPSAFIITYSVGRKQRGGGNKRKKMGGGR